MRAAALYSAAGSLLLTTLAAAPATGAPDAVESAGTALAAAHARARGIDFGKCPDAQDMPGTMECGTVSVPLD